MRDSLMLSIGGADMGISQIQDLQPSWSAAGSECPPYHGGILCRRSVLRAGEIQWQNIFNNEKMRYKNKK